MARQKGIIRIKGNLGGISFYEVDGQGFAREQSSVNKQRIMSDPAYQRTRENMSEFAGSAMAAKSLRLSFATLNAIFADRAQFGRFLSALKKVLNRGAGARGERSIEIVANKDLLEGLAFNKKVKLGEVLQAPFTLASTSARDEATLTVPDFDTGAYLKAPPAATHFRLVCAIGTLSDHVYDSLSGKYEATDPAENSLGEVVRSAEIQLGGMVGSVTTLNPVLAGSVTIPSSVALLAAVGVEFLQEVNGNYYLLAQANAMDIIQVF